jgi:peroxiredoxin Q/BCP
VDCEIDERKARFDMLTEGSLAHDVDLFADDGSKVRLSKLKGRPVVLYFYPKDDTSGCTAEAKDFGCLLHDFQAVGADVFGISPDSVESHVKFKKKHAIDIRLLADPDKVAAEAFGVWVEKSMYGRKYMGVERATFLIDAKGRIAKAWRKVKVSGHAQEVLASVVGLAAKR